MDSILNTEETITALPLDAALIESALARLWRESFREAGAAARLHRITLSNLIVFSSIQNREEAETIARLYAYRKPSRVITVVIDNKFDGNSHAYITASCNLIDGLTEHLCWEQIVIEAAPGDLPRLVGLVRSLLTGGQIPIILVDLYGLKGEIDFRRKFYRMPDYVFVDCNGQFQMLLPPPGIFDDRQLYGFEWVTIDPLREAVRHFFDGPVHLDLINHLTKIAITCGSIGGDISPEAQLLAGWLISSLDLKVDTSFGLTIGTYHIDGRKVAVEFSPEKNQDSSHIEVNMHFDNKPNALRFTNHSGQVMISFGAYQEQFVPTKPFDRTAFVIEQSSKDRLRSSYAVSYRAAVLNFNLLRGKTGRRSMIVVENPARLATVAARLFYSVALRTLAYKDKFFVALAGGTTPKAMYREMVKSPYAGAVDWDQVYFFFGDERPVGPDHPDSNFKLAEDYLLRPLGIPADHVFRIEGENPLYRETCRKYTETINKLLPTDETGIPRFDLILLGVGEDGHTASLFPETDFDKLDPERLIVYKFVPSLGHYRISFTLRLINSAAQVFFVASGTSKAAALHSVFFPEHESLLPAARVQPHDGNVLWLIDSGAASRLSGAVLPLEVSRW